MPNILGQQLYGWYSQQAANRWGYSVYSTKDGRKVCVTLICVDPTYAGTNYLWADKQTIGPIETKLSDVDGPESEADRELDRELARREMAEYETPYEDDTMGEMSYEYDEDAL